MTASASPAPGRPAPSSPPPSQRAAAELLPPGTHVMKNGGRSTYVVDRVEHALRDGRWGTTAVAKLYGNRHLTGGGSDHFLGPLRLVDGVLTLVGEGWLDVIAPEQAAAFEAEINASYPRGACGR